MQLPIGQGVSYGKTPDSPHCVNVTLSRDSFTNVSSLVCFPNNLANPDAYDSQLDPAAAQRGYLGYKAEFDIGNAMRSVGMSYVQSVFIDNSQGAGTLILHCLATKMQITVAPGNQGVYPLILPLGSNNTFECAYIDPNGDDNSTVPSFAWYPDTSPTFTEGTGGPFMGWQVQSGFIRMQFLDVVMPIGQWQTRNYSTARWIDVPTSINVANTYQTALSPNPFRKGFMIGNPGSALEPLLVMLRASFQLSYEQGSITLLPGQYYKEAWPDIVSLDRVRIAAATVGRLVTVKYLF